MNIDLYNLIASELGIPQKVFHMTAILPYEKLIAELIRDDEPVPVPVDYALEHIFTDISTTEFCERYHLNVETVVYTFKGQQLPRAFFIFSIKE